MQGLLFLSLTLLVTIAYLIQGDYPLLSVLWQQGWTPEVQLVLVGLRLSRLLVAGLVGVGLAIAGTIIQGITRNPLASPTVLGVNAGAVLTVVTCLVWFPQFPPLALPGVAFLGGCAIAFLVYLLSQNSTPKRLILIGVGCTFLAQSATNFVFVFGKINSVSQALIWLTGSVYGRSWPQVWALLPWVILLGGGALLMTQALNIQALGEDVALSLGANVGQQQFILLGLSIGLSSAAVAIAGAIAFIGLISPHIARKWVGVSHEKLLPTAAWVGGILMITADGLGQWLFSPLELPCGLITATLGAPYFIYLIVSK